MLFRGSFITTASGSMGGITASRNAGGQYLRSRATPVNPNTTAQQAARNALATLNTQWIETLTQANRDSWDDYAANVPVENALGDTKFLKGQQWFIGNNVPRVIAGLTVIATGPAIYDRGTETPGTFDALSGPDLDVAFNDADDWASEDGAAMVLQIGIPVNETVNSFKGPFTFAGIIEGDSIAPPASPFQVTLPFDATVGAKYFIRTRVSRADGRLTSTAVSAGVAT